MALTVGQHALMPAVSGLLRSGASRSDWHPAGTKVPLYALSNVARSNATRSNYTSGRAFVGIDGIVLPPRTTALDPGILIDSLQITDLLNYEANRCTFVAWGFTPHEGQRIVVTIGSVNNRERLFAGRILNTEQFYKGKPTSLYVSVNAIDDTWGLDARKVSERYTAMSYEAIVRDLLAKYAAPTYTAAVEPGLGSLNEITFTNQDLTSALTQLAKRGGYQWLCDEQAVVRLFETNPGGTPPTILNAAHPSLDAFAVQRDLSQLVTRVYVEGGGVNAFAAVAVGETILPVEDAAWYPPAGVVVSGPQRIKYSGTYPGGGGGLVGTGASPSGAPQLAAAPGAGLSPGTRDYAVTFVTAAGESIAGPRATITSGPTASPPTAPTVSAPTAATGPGVGPDPGVHDYAVTFVTASGETTPGPRATVSTGETAGPTGYPVPSAPTAGPGVDAGAHEYAVSFVTAIGETLAGPISPAVTVGPLPPPASAPVPGIPTAGTGPDVGSHDYVVTFGTAIGETLPGPSTGALPTGTLAPPATALTAGTPTRGAGPEDGEYYYQTTFVTAQGETTMGPYAGPVFTTSPLLGPPTVAPVLAGVHPSFAQGADPAHGYVIGASVQWAVAYAVDASQTKVTPIGPPSAVWIVTKGPVGAADSCGIPNVSYYDARPSDPAVTHMLVYERIGGGPWSFVSQDPVGGSWDTGFSTWSHAPSDLPKPPPGTAAAATHTVPLSAIPLGGPTVTARRIYRAPAGGTYQRVTELANNTATTFTDTVPTAGVVAPTVSTAYLQRLPLSNIPIGDATVTRRSLYRRFNGAGPYLLVTTLANNSATTFTDTVPNASLGAAAPSVATAPMGVVHLTAIPTGESGSGVTARILYRRSGGAGLRVLATLAGNSATTYTDTMPNASLGVAPPSVSTAVLIHFALSAIAKGGALVTARKLYRTSSGSSSLKLLATLADNTTTTYVDVTPDGGLGAAPPATTTATANQVQLAAIPIGAAAVTARKVYRTIAAGAQLKLLTTLADNTTTAWLDAAADATLGANVNTVDTSGLTQPQGNVVAGSTSLQIANIGPFPPEGWAVIGNGETVIRYHGVSGNVLTGIPASGPGAITASIAYNSTVTAAPQLVGIPATGAGMIRYPILKGDPVNLWVQADDLAAQATLAALMGTDGIVEGYLQDRRLSYTEALARAAAQLALRGALEIGISYTSRDVNTRAGRLVTVNLPSQHVAGSFQVRQVVITRFGIPNLPPTFTASASTDRFSFEALIRAARKDGT